MNFKLILMSFELMKWFGIIASFKYTSQHD